MSNYRGVPEIEFIWHGERNDPELCYKDHLFNYWAVEDELYEMFKRENVSCESPIDEEIKFNDFVKLYAVALLERELEV